ncbi:hypothetical protein D1BOALGB6SA_2693 [Olavius sp. associated proteobacterium Delta 1]|nr:hypothetical protein D1BOALGB6SA_2693 [Olavius sp. associated proteobacterium Delta 1]
MPVVFVSREKECGSRVHVFSIETHQAIALVILFLSAPIASNDLTRRSTDFKGVLNTDDYAAHNAANAQQRQTCLAHIIRRAKEIKPEIVLRKAKYQDPQAIEFCDQIGSLLKDACPVGGNLKNRDAQDPNRNRQQKLFYDQLDSICNCELDDEKTETLRTRLRDPTRLYPNIA